MKSLRKVGAITAVGVLTAGTTFALTFDAWKAELPQKAVNYKIVVGERAAAADVIGAVELAAALQKVSVKEKEISVPVEGVVLEKTTAKYAGEVPLYKETDKIVLGEGLTGGGVAVVSEGLVFGSKTFEDAKGNKYDYLLKLYPNSAVTVQYKDKPDTDADDPVVMLYAGNNYVYQLVVSFTKPLQDSDGDGIADNVKAQEIELFGKKFYIDEITNNKWVLREAAKTATLKPGETVEFEGKTIKLVDVVEETTSTGGKIYAAIVEVNGERKKVTEGNSETIGGVDVFVKDAYVSTTQQGVAYAELVIGGKKIELVTNSNAKVGDQELDNVYVAQANLNGLILQVKFASDSNKNYLEAGKEFVDPLFGTFKLVFAPVDLKAGKLEVKLEPDSSTVWKITVTDFRGYTKTVNVLEAVDQNNDGALDDATDYVGLYSKIKGTIYGDSGDAVNGPTLEPGEYVAIVDTQTKESYLLRLESIQTDKVVFKDVFADKTIEVPLVDTNNDGTPDYGTLNVGAQSYTFLVGDADNDGTKDITFKLGSNTEFSTSVVEFYTKDAQRIVVQAGQAVDKDKDGTLDSEQPAQVKIYENDDSTDTNVDITLQIAVDENDKRVEFQGTVAVGDAEGTLGTTAFQEKVGDYDYRVLGQYGAYIEYNTKDQGYVRVYLPKEQVWYGVKLVPTKAETVTETETVKVGETVPGTEWKVKEVKVPESVKTEEVVPLPVGQVGLLDSEVPSPWYQGGYEGLIVVGGPCVNRVAAELLNKTYPACGAASGIPENAALVKVVEEGGKVAVLVAGWEWVDTRKAARMLAEYIAEGKHKEVFEGKEEVTISR